MAQDGGNFPGGRGPGGGARNGGARALALPGRRGRRLAVRLAEWAERALASLVSAVVLEADRRRFFLWLPVLFGAGGVAYFSAEVEPSLPAALSALAILLLAAALARRRVVFLALLGMCALLGGFIGGAVKTAALATQTLAAPASVTVQGRITTLDHTVYGARFVVEVQDFLPAVERMPSRIRVTFRGKTTLRSGDGVLFQARLTPPGEPSVPGGFDFQREAYFQRLGAVGLVTGALTPAADLPPASIRARFEAAIDRGRNALTARIIDVVGGSTGAIAAALITGKRGQIAEADNERWRAAGIYHIVSISGLHMALAAGLFFWTARIIFTLGTGARGRRPVKKWAALVAMAGATAYDVFSGSDVATERSLIMTLVMLGAILVDRPALAMRNLAIAGLIVLAMRPESVLGPSFQMSFSAVAGLVAYAEAMRRWRERRPERLQDQGVAGRVAQFGLDFVMTSLIAGLATAPFQAYHFHRLNPYGLLGNALAIPLCSLVVMPSALVGVVLYPLGLDAPVWSLMGAGVDGIQIFAAWVSGLSGAVATTLRFSAATLAMIAFGMALVILMTTPPFRVFGGACIAAGLLMWSRAPQPALILDPAGNAALVRGADGRMVLLGRRRPVFALQQWLPGDGDARQPRDPTLTTGALCDRLGCVASPADIGAVALTLDPAAFADDCERAAVVISPLPAPPSCRAGAASANPTVYDRAHFANYGATYVYGAGAAAKLETARNPRTDRPWSPRSAGRANIPAPSPPASITSKPSYPLRSPEPETADPDAADPPPDAR